MLGLLLVGCGSVKSTTDSTESASVSTSSTSELTANEVLILGDISKKPTQKIERYQPLANYLANRLEDVGIKKATVKIAPDLETMETWIESGEVDLYFDSPYPVIVVSTKTGATPILRRWKKGVAEYNSIIFTRNDSDIDTIADLQGKQIALESNISTSGYMLPLAYLKEAGLILVEQSLDIEESLDNKSLQVNEVGFIFSGDEDNTVELILTDKVDAGAVDSGTFAELPDDVKSSMKVILETEFVARHIVLASPRLPTEQINAIEALLLDMDKSPEGETTLESFEDTVKFDDFPVEQSIERLKELYDLTF
ncbi:phosphate/phosphite/phosphonate ABC transporter substrate-binding protein [Leptothoe sp. LEGE 181152]|nr:phosphate/phosphite/phosphonate ABC transporter substrate-binding protein [Leptothoe sp. LEGE 181152]